MMSETPAKTADASSQTSTSVAQTYTKTFQTQVNPRTGLLSVSIAPPVLSGVRSMDVNLGVTYSQGMTNPTQRFFGLPYGWSFPLSYMSGSTLVVNGTQSYQIDQYYESGLQYYYKTDLKLVQCSPTPLKYDPSLQYSSYLTMLGGHVQYFDGYGKLICWADKSDNHIIYTYDNSNSLITEAKLTQVLDTYGQKILLSHSASEIKITYPDSVLGTTIQFSYGITSGGDLSPYTDPTNEETIFTYGGDNYYRYDLLTDIAYPNQSSTHIAYDSIQYILEGDTADSRQDVVSSVTQTCPSLTRVTKYDYNPDNIPNGIPNYLGYNDYEVCPGSDSLFESNNDTYTYKTSINNGLTEVTNEYNHLHLLLTSTVKSADKTELFKKTTYHYPGESTDGNGNTTFPPTNDLDPNYQQATTTLSTFHYEGETRQEKVVRSYDPNTSQLLSLSEYETVDGTLKLVRKEVTTYDDRFNVPTLLTLYDYKPQGTPCDTPEVIQTSNTLSDDGRYILSSTRKAKVGDTFEAKLVNTVHYDGAGRLSFYEREWVASNQPGIPNVTSTFEFDYDSTSRSLTRTQKGGNGDVLSVEIYDTATGLLASQSNALNATTTYQYDGLGRPLNQTDPMGYVTHWSYDIPNNKITQTAPNGYVTYSYLSGFGKLLVKSDNLGSGGTERTLQTNTYNDLGQLYTQSGILGDVSTLTYLYDPRGKMSQKSDTHGNVETYTNDPVACSQTTTLNGVQSKEVVYTLKRNNAQRKYQRRHKKRHKRRMESSVKRFDTHKSGEFSCITRLWNGLQLNVGVHLGNQDTSKKYWVSKQYDIIQRPIHEVLNSKDSTRTLDYTRDLHGKILQSTCTVVDEQGHSQTSNSSTRQYGEFAQLQTETTATNAARTFQYDGAGNRTHLVDFSGNEFISTYTDNNQIYTRTYTDNGSKIKLVYEYSSVGKLDSITRTIDDGAPEVMVYSYTLDGNILSITYPDQKSVSWTYHDDTGLLDTFTDAFGNVTNYVYYEDGRLKEVVRDDISASVKLTYVTKDIDPTNVGEVESLTFSNGVVLTSQYDGYGCPHQIKAQSESPTLTVTYTRDNVTTFVEGVSYQCPGVLDSKLVLEFDGVGRVKNESVSNASDDPIGSIAYGYDAVANVKTRTDTKGGDDRSITYHYDEDSQMSSVEVGGESTQLQYDPNGNLKQDESGNTYEYNALNQLTKFTPVQGESTVYTYYPNGMRATKQSGDDEIITYYYNNANHPDIVNEVQGDVEASYLMAGSYRLARLLKNGATTTVETYLLERDSVLATFDGAGSIQDVTTYDAYGNSQPRSGDITSNPFGYRGEYTDVESGQVYLRARYYSPKRMNFINRDSILTINPYNYADGNPIMYKDPSGHIPTWGIVLIAVGGSIALGAAFLGVGEVLSGCLVGDVLGGEELGGDAIDGIDGAEDADAARGAGEAGDAGDDEDAGDADGEEADEDDGGAGVEEEEVNNGRGIRKLEHGDVVKRMTGREILDLENNQLLQIFKTDNDQYTVSLLSRSEMVSNDEPLSLDEKALQEQGIYKRRVYQHQFGLNIKPAH
ncbi:MAG: hypothetical protein CL920_30255 [Deltaproteobacteria bacterium]|nr:hypothetical protein [Deltaproteobacteria bacterium]MBU52996.1 hypothetical protein [Deltaproteobacteria bacterium]